VARLTHLASEKHAKSILRAGIRASDLRDGLQGVFAMPVLPDFYVSHQWLRELKRWGPPPYVAIDFVVPDSEPVLVGHYNKGHADMTAAQAAGLILHAEDARGYEVVVLRAILPAEIRKARAVPQVVGWRYMPDAHGRPPCGCPVCLAPGSFGAADIRARFDD
jgi:hypothetical protein